MERNPVNELHELRIACARVAVNKVFSKITSVHNGSLSIAIINNYFVLALEEVFKYGTFTLKYFVYPNTRELAVQITFADQTINFRNYVSPIDIQLSPTFNGNVDLVIENVIKPVAHVNDGHGDFKDDKLNSPLPTNAAFLEQVYGRAEEIFKERCRVSDEFSLMDFEEDLREAIDPGGRNSVFTHVLDKKQQVLKITVQNPGYEPVCFTFGTKGVCKGFFWPKEMDARVAIIPNDVTVQHTGHSPASKEEMIFADAIAETHSTLCAKDECHLADLKQGILDYIESVDNELRVVISFFYNRKLEELEVRVYSHGIERDWIAVNIKDVQPGDDCSPIPDQCEHWLEIAPVVKPKGSGFICKNKPKSNVYMSKHGVNADIEKVFIDSAIMAVAALKKNPSRLASFPISGFSDLVRSEDWEFQPLCDAYFKYDADYNANVLQVTISYLHFSVTCVIVDFDLERKYGGIIVLPTGDNKCGEEIFPTSEPEPGLEVSLTTNLETEIQNSSGSVARAVSSFVLRPDFLQDHVETAFKKTIERMSSIVGVVSLTTMDNILREQFPEPSLLHMVSHSFVVDCEKNELQVTLTLGNQPYVTTIKDVVDDRTFFWMDGMNVKKINNRLEESKETKADSSISADEIIMIDAMAHDCFTYEKLTHKLRLTIEGLIIACTKRLQKNGWDLTVEYKRLGCDSCFITVTNDDLKLTELRVYLPKECFEPVEKLPATISNVRLFLNEYRDYSFGPSVLEAQLLSRFNCKRASVDIRNDGWSVCIGDLFGLFIQNDQMKS